MDGNLHGDFGDPRVNLTVFLSSELQTGRLMIFLQFKKHQRRYVLCRRKNGGI